MLLQKYEAMFQGPHLDLFGQMSTKLLSPPVDPITKVAVLRKDNVTVHIENYENLDSKLSVSVHKLFDILVLLLSQQNQFRNKAQIYDTIVNCSLDDYMALCAIPPTKASRDETRMQVKKDLEMLSRISISWNVNNETKRKKQDILPQYWNKKLFTFCGIKKGVITANFTEELTSYLSNSFVTRFPTTLLTLDQRNANSYYIGKKLTYHYGLRSNVRRETNSCISVSSLLSATPDIPYQRIIDQDPGHWSRRIRVPLEKALRSLEDTKIIDSWGYCFAKRQPISSLDDVASTFYNFSKLYIFFEIKDFPPPEKQVKGNKHKERNSSNGK